MKILLERLIRRYGYEAVEAHVPPQHHPLLHAVKKTIQEKKKAKAKVKATQKPAIDGEESELKAPKMGQSWILDSNDEPIDFTDPSHIQRVTCTYTLAQSTPSAPLIPENAVVQPAIRAQGLPKRRRRSPLRQAPMVACSSRIRTTNKRSRPRRNGSNRARRGKLSTPCWQAVPVRGLLISLA